MTWFAVLAACSGRWPMYVFPSFVLFSIHAALYVLAGRSLTPTIVAHSLYHVLCAPYLLMFAMTQIPG